MGFPVGDTTPGCIIHFLSPFGKPFLHLSREDFVGSQVSDGRVEAFRVVEGYPPAHFLLCVNDSEIGTTADFFRLERPMHAFDLPVALRMERGRRGLLQLQFRHEVQEVTRRELAPVIVDDAGVRVGVELLRAGHEYLDVYRLHCREQVPDDDLAAEPVKDAGEVVEHPADPHVGEVRMPLLVWSLWLVEALLLRFRRRGPFREEVVAPQDVVHGGRADTGDVEVHHEPREVAVAPQPVAVQAAEVHDCLRLLGRHPVGLGRVVVVACLVVLARLPFVPGAPGKPQERQQHGLPDTCPRVHRTDLVDDGRPFG